MGDPAELAWPPALAPYLAVDDARRALDWYVEVFEAERRGEPFVMDDGRIGHAELGIGDAVLMVADEFPEIGVQAPVAGAAASQSIHVQVGDADATVARAVAGGAQVSRPVVDEPHGRTGVIVDPFGHRWLVNTPPVHATRHRHGDIGYVTIAAPDATRTRAFYGAVLGWTYAGGSVEEGYEVMNASLMTGLSGGTAPPQVWLCYRVADVDAAVERVRAQGGMAEEPKAKPYGRLAECVDDQGLRFQVWQPGG